MPLVATEHFIKSVVSAKIRVFLFVLMTLYVPTVVVLLRAMIPHYDWNDSRTTPFRRRENVQVRRNP